MVVAVVVIGLGLLIFGRNPNRPEEPTAARRLIEAVSRKTGAKPDCPDPFTFTMSVDSSKITSVLYPWQKRGGEYKAHGGFYFDGSRPDEITVTAPYDAEVVAGARYPVNGELQYTFDFEHERGIKYRFGRLLTLSPKFAALADKFTLPTGLDSRTTQVQPPIKVKQGEVIATAVGLTQGGEGGIGANNTLVD